MTSSKKSVKVGKKQRGSNPCCFLIFRLDMLFCRYPISGRGGALFAGIFLVSIAGFRESKTRLELILLRESRPARRDFCKAIISACRAGRGATENPTRSKKKSACPKNGRWAGAD